MTQRLPVAAVGALAAVSLLLTSVSAVGQNRLAPQRDVKESSALQSKLTRFQASDLALPAADPDAFSVTINLDGTNRVLDFGRVSLRSPSFRVLVDHGNGALEQVPAPPPRTYRGSVRDLPGSTVVGSLIDGRLSAVVYPPDGEAIVIEPAASLDPAAPAGRHVIYRTSDVVPAPGSCGNDFYQVGVPQRQEEPPLPMEGDEAGDGGIAGTGLHVIEIAFDADYEFFQKNGNSVTQTVNDIENVFSSVEFIYERDVSITFEISAIVIRSSVSDPYTSNVADELLCEFRSTWNSDPEDGIKRDVAQLFTGKSLVGSTIGLAWAGVVCSGNGIACGAFGNSSYSLVESKYFGGSFNERVSLSCHEIGHNLSASHCNGDGDCHIMCSSNGGCNGIGGSNLKFGAAAVASITSHLNSIACDQILPEPLTIPFVETFPNNSINSTRWTFNKGGTSSTAATNEPSAPNSLNLDASGSGQYDWDEIRSNVIQLGGLTNVKLEYWVQHKNVEVGKNLFVEYLNTAQDWILLNTIASTGVSQTDFVHYEHALPAAARHNGFRLRFRTDSVAGNDDWYIDDIRIDVFTPPPANDECSGATQIVMGENAFSTLGATTSGPSLPVSCNEGAGTQMNNDVWYFYLSFCNGTLSISTCNDATFDTRIAVYDYGDGCAGADAAVLACNDNGPGCADGTSTVEFSAQAGKAYLVRVGSTSGTGTGTLTLSCADAPPPPPACPGDLDRSGAVDGADLGLLLGNWGGSGTGDLNADGAVDGADLGLLLAEWGVCPTS